MKLFLQDIERKTADRIGNSLDLDVLKKIPLNNLECLCLFDLTKNKILFHKGFDKVFGYQEKELDMDFIFDKYHPEDRPIIHNIIRELVVQMVEITIPEYSNILNLSYRFRKKDDSFARVLSNTIVYQTDDRDRILNILIKYTDISFTHDSDAVEWMVDGTYIDMDRIKSEVYGEEKIFTPRELEVIGQIFHGRTNVEIANSLMISVHTVSTHRKNILFKSNCSDAAELKLYCKRNGVLTSPIKEVSK